ncbi:MAG: cupin domain-containing protein [Cyanobacteria bacterium P01_F01_bin.53]
MMLPNLFALASQPDSLAWKPFRPGVEIHRLYGDSKRGPSAALLKYEPGATVPQHSHTGYEHIIVLSGAQSDAQGTYPAGTLVINPPGSQHNIVSDAGCIVLIIWEKPVVIQEDNANA